MGLLGAGANAYAENIDGSNFYDLARESNAVIREVAEAHGVQAAVPCENEKKGTRRIAFSNILGSSCAPRGF